MNGIREDKDVITNKLDVYDDKIVDMAQIIADGLLCEYGSSAMDANIAGRPMSGFVFDMRRDTDLMIVPLRLDL
jgi:hypothetical protein